METEAINTIAQEILQVLKCDPFVLMSWGAHDFKDVLYDNKAALEFSVNGFLHKGKVIVAYNGGDDLYEVFSLDRNNEVVEHSNGIYFDTLTNTIDRMVEKECSDEEYHQKCRNWLEETGI